MEINKEENFHEYTQDVAYVVPMSLIKKLGKRSDERLLEPCQASVKRMEDQCKVGVE